MRSRRSLHSTRAACILTSSITSSPTPMKTQPMLSLLNSLHNICRIKVFQFVQNLSLMFNIIRLDQMWCLPVRILITDKKSLSFSSQTFSISKIGYMEQTHIIYVVYQPVLNPSTDIGLYHSSRYLFFSGVTEYDNVSTNFLTFSLSRPQMCLSMVPLFFEGIVTMPVANVDHQKIATPSFLDNRFTLRPLR